MCSSGTRLHSLIDNRLPVAPTAEINKPTAGTHATQKEFAAGRQRPALATRSGMPTNEVYTTTSQRGTMTNDMQSIRRLHPFTHSTPLLYRHEIDLFESH